MSEARTLAISIKTDASGAIADVQKLNNTVNQTEKETKKLKATNAQLARDAAGIWRSLQTPTEKYEAQLKKLEAAMKVEGNDLERNAKSAERLRQKIDELAEAEKRLAQAEVDAAAKRAENEKKKAEDEAKRIRREKGEYGDVGIKFAESEAGKALGGGKFAEGVGKAGAVVAAVEIAGRLMDKLGETTEKYSEALSHAEYSSGEMAGHLISATPIIGTFFDGADRLAGGLRDTASSAAKWLGYSKETVDWLKSANAIMKEIEEHGKQMDKQFAALAKLREADRNETENLKRLREENELLAEGNEWERERKKLRQENQAALDDIAKKEAEYNQLAREGKNNDASVFTTLAEQRAELERKLQQELNEVDEKEKLDTQKKLEEQQKKAADQAKKDQEVQRKKSLEFLSKLGGKIVDLGWNKTNEAWLKKQFEAEKKRVEEQKKDAKAIADSVASPIEKAAMEVAKAKKLLDAGAIDQATFDKFQKNQTDGLLSQAPKYTAPGLAEAGSVAEYQIRQAEEARKIEEKWRAEQLKKLEEEIAVQQRILEELEKANQKEQFTVVTM